LKRPQQENFDTDHLDNVNIGPLNEEINFSITQEEILRCIKKLKNNKACLPKGCWVVFYPYPYSTVSSILLGLMFLILPVGEQL
jgi:hypothetical protein